ncbi:hypothetical protein ACOMHN_048234 [Nucella lapillus]
MKDRGQGYGGQRSGIWGTEVRDIGTEVMDKGDKGQGHGGQREWGTKVRDMGDRALRLLSHSTSRLQDDVYKHIIELGILHNSPPSTKRGCRAGRLHRLWHGLPPAPWPCTRSQHHSVPSRNLHPLMVPPFLQPHPDLQSAVGNAPLSSKHPAQLPTTDCLLSIISPMGGQPSDAPALSPPSPLQQGGQSSNAPALSPPSPLPQGGQPIALALSPPSPPLQGGQPSDAPGLSTSSSTLLLCPSDSTLNICHLNFQSAVKTAAWSKCVMTGLAAWSKCVMTLWLNGLVQVCDDSGLAAWSKCVMTGLVAWSKCVMTLWLNGLVQVCNDSGLAAWSKCVITGLAAWSKCVMTLWLNGLVQVCDDSGLAA